MKNIHILPTYKPSRLYFNHNKGFEKYQFSKEPFINGLTNTTNQNIYITSDEEIKEGDWFLYDLEHDPIGIRKCISISSKGRINDDFLNYRDSKVGYGTFKIILTTDQDLINDGVQSIPNDFLEWFVKNPTCEYVEIKKILQTRWGTEWHDLPNQIEGRERDGIYRNIYRIIIPKEENHFLERGITIIDVTRQKLGAHHPDCTALLKPVGEQLNKNLYSEEELNDLLETILSKKYDNGEMFDVVSTYDIKKVFEQFKK